MGPHFQELQFVQLTMTTVLPGQEPDPEPVVQTDSIQEPPSSHDVAQQ
jgi:hypothetical protein